jgi:hypothetical protein
MFFNCYKDRDNPVIYLKEIQNAPLAQWGGMENAIVDALAWAQEATGQSASPYRGFVLTLPTFGGWRIFFGTRYITAKRSGASCAGVRFERLSDVQRFRAAALKTLEVLR